MTTRFIPLILFFFAFGTLGAQNSDPSPLTEQLGGVRTDFNMVIQGDTIPLMDQAIYLRGNIRWDIDAVLEYGAGAGLQNYRYEVLIDHAPEILEKLNRRRTNLQMRFYDSAGNMIYSGRFGSGLVQLIYSENRPTWMSVNLINIPFLILDRTDTISLIVV